MSTLSDPLSLSAPRGADAGLTPQQLVAKYGLTVSGARPPLRKYVRQLWSRRHFIMSFATARLVAQYSTAKLGQVWQVVTPLLNCVVYFLVFGLILSGSKSMDYYIPWLCIGVFTFQFIQTAVQSGTRAISDSLGLIRALHFPRACLPIAFTIIQLQQLLISMVVLVAIVLISGISPGLTWLLVIPAVALLCVFNTGLALAMARVGAKTTDMAQLMPFILRTWMYLSGVFYSIEANIKSWPHWIQVMADVNPAAVYMDLIRYAFDPSAINRAGLPPHVWAVSVGWAVVAGLFGFVFFWKAEEQYGRG
ncbi:ABC transporter permease [Streptomyces sp. NRRL B-24484]|uniref:ABC transporter permease n=1 Tax=Streptomyces sp. NRRL B-24484 TaxID=1463833 RepID=UPI0004C00FE6|nr:ABC transporter permease [Streptomyces sp. NRRL B-24484]